ncbi:ABC transporter family substrate-binding protein [Streptosporangium sp. KLBMP 9127]|nr:ABC transporter family substrate-binding protein [Streptosporangium sp. KLBMP 9127]
MRIFGVVVLCGTLVAAGALAGCASRPKVAGSDMGSSVKAFDINQLSRDQIKDGGTLRWGINEYPAQWNLNHVDGNLMHVRSIVSALLPAPFRSDEMATISVDHDYLIDGKITASRPKQVVTLTLNPRARWSDGRPITWQDYEAQWKAMRGENADYRVTSMTGYQDIESVARGKDDYQVVITFERPFGDWQSLFGPLYPKTANATPNAFNTAWLNKIPVTAGPFTLQGFDPTAKTITLARDPKWWGAKAKLDQIIFRALESDALVGAFSNGELDLFDVGPSAPDYARAKNTRDAVVRQAAGPDFRHLTMNGQSEILKDPAVRQAIAMGVNRQAIAQSDLQGLGWPITLLGNHFFMNSQKGYHDNSGEIGVYDPAKARQRLDAAGWRLTGRVREKDGRQLRLRFVMPSGLQLSKSEGEMVQSMLQQVGVKVVLQAVPGDDFFGKYIIPGNYDLTAFSYIGTPYPVSSSYGQYVNAMTDSTGQRQWNANLGRIGVPEIDKALQRAAVELDPARARAATNVADALIWRQVNVLPLYQRPQNVAVKSTLANAGARGFYDLRYADIGFTR